MDYIPMPNLSHELSLWIWLLEEKLICKWQSIPFADISVLSKANWPVKIQRLQIGSNFFLKKKNVVVLITFKMSSDVHSVIQCYTLIGGSVSGIAAWRAL